MNEKKRMNNNVKLKNHRIFPSSFVSSSSFYESLYHPVAVVVVVVVVVVVEYDCADETLRTDPSLIYVDDGMEEDMMMHFYQSSFWYRMYHYWS